MKSPALYAAEIYDSSPSSQPLLADDDSDVQSVSSGAQAEQVRSSLTRESLLAGILFGSILQACTLGINTALLLLWQSHVLPRSKYDVLTASLLWSFTTSIISIVTMGYLRRRALDKHGEEILDEQVLTKLECRFVVGAVNGICLSWTALDLATGNYPCLLTTLATLVGALICCHMLSWYYSTYPQESKEVETSGNIDTV